MLRVVNGKTSISRVVIGCASTKCADERPDLLIFKGFGEGAVSLISPSIFPLPFNLVCEFGTS